MKTRIPIRPQLESTVSGGEELQFFANFFKALSEPLRLRILYLLIKKGELCVCDLITALATPQSVVSRHLAYLRRHQLISARRAGIWVHYSITPQSLFTDQLLNLLGQNESLATVCAVDLDCLTQSITCC